jgi:hypothetical protein
LRDPVVVFGNEVVLELKFTDRFPDWFKELVRVFGLMQCGAAKYVEGVTLIGQHRIRHAFALADQENDLRESAAATAGYASPHPSGKAVP